MTTRIITFFVGNPYKPSFPLGTTQTVTDWMFSSVPVRVFSFLKNGVKKMLGENSVHSI